MNFLSQAKRGCCHAIFVIGSYKKNIHSEIQYNLSGIFRNDSGAKRKGDKWCRRYIWGQKDPVV